MCLIKVFPLLLKLKQTCFFLKGLIDIHSLHFFIHQSLPLDFDFHIFMNFGSDAFLLCCAKTMALKKIICNTK